MKMEQVLQKNEDEAFKWYLKAAEQGDAEAQFRVGCAYDLGEGVAENKTKALNWYTKAAEQGQPDARFKVRR